MCCFKKIMKIVAVIAAIAAAAAAVYFLIKKIKEKKALAGDEEDLDASYVPCSCELDEPIVVEEDTPAEE